MTNILNLAKATNNDSYFNINLCIWLWIKITATLSSKINNESIIILVRNICK